MNICIFDLRENNPFIGGVERVSYTLIKEWVKYSDVICISAYRSQINIDYKPLCPEFFLPNKLKIVCQENMDFVLSIIKQYKIDVVLNQGSVFDDLCELCYNVRNGSSVKLITAIHYAPHQMNIAAENNFFIRLRMNSWIRFLKEVLYIMNYYALGKRRLIMQERLSIQRITRNSDKVVILSKHYLRDYCRYIPKNDYKKFFVIPNPLNDINKDLKFPYKRNQIIYVGRLEFGLKRVDRLLRIWERIAADFPKWNFVIVGDGGIRKDLEKYAYIKKIPRIQFVGFQDPYSYYLDSSILCMSSSVEGFGMVLLEAQKNYCVPIAYGSFGAINDIIESGKTGEIVSPFSEDEYVEKLMHLMNDSLYRENLAREAFRSVSRYEASIIAKQWITMFEKIK